VLNSGKRARKIEDQIESRKENTWFAENGEKREREERERERERGKDSAD